jgi:hypothetical protein
MVFFNRACNCHRIFLSLCAIIEQCILAQLFPRRGGARPVPNRAEKLFNKSLGIDEIVELVFRSAGKTKNAFVKIEKNPSPALRK